MKFEVVKTYILVFLVGLSLVLTYNIWTYKPSQENVSDVQSQYVHEDEFYLDGKVVTKKDVIIPKSILFQNKGKLYSFKSPRDSETLYRDLQSWVMDDFKMSKSGKIPNKKQQVEIQFPEQLPMEIVPSLFTFKDEIKNLPSWSFERLFITFNPNKPIMHIRFLSIDGKQEASAVIENATNYERLWSYIEDTDQLQEMIAVQKSDMPIYIPKGSPEKYRKSLSIDMAKLNQAPKKLVNALFSYPSSVTRNLSDTEISYYTDGRRQMQVDQERQTVEFTNPNQMELLERMHPIELIERSVLNINEHKGWTNDYQLESIDISNNKIVYLMYYQGNPILGGSFSKIEQEWRKQELFQYERPLFSINDTLADEPVELMSGQEMITFLQNSKTYNFEKITDIRIGYNLYHQDHTSYILLLEPAWFLEYEGNWIEIRFDEPEFNSEVS